MAMRPATVSLAAVALLFAGCAIAPGGSPSSAASPEAPSLAASTAPVTTPTASPTPSPGVLWPVDRSPAVTCAVSRQIPTQDASGSWPYPGVAEATLDAAFGRFLAVDGSVIGYVPLDDWSKVAGSGQWGHFDYLVDGVPKASALFSAVPEASDTRWSWDVAACDPAEYAPGVQVSGGLVVWSTASGDRVPAARLLERPICGSPTGPRTLRLTGVGVFAGADPDLTFSGRLLTSYAADVRVPPTATATGYTSNGRGLWVAVDSNAVFLGTVEHAERWPRLGHDDDSVTDCN